jgi:hypothetical protein
VLLHLSGEPVSIEVVGITVVDGKVLVVLPKLGLSKATLFDIQFCLEKDPSEPADEDLGRLWIGFLSEELAGSLMIGGAGEPTFTVKTILEDEPALIPFGPVLLQVANDHFAFVTATEDAGLEEAPKGEIESRMQKMESMMQELRSAVMDLKGTPKTGKEPRAAATPKKAAGGASKKDALLGLDPAVVESARAMGAARGSIGPSFKAGVQKRLEDAPARKKVTELSETEEEEDEEEEAAGSAVRAEPVQQAVIKLTKIVSNLAKPKKKASDLDAQITRNSRLP